MKYKDIPFVATLDQTKKVSPEHVAQQLEQIISAQNSDGWEYVRIESVSTWVAPDSGCFGIGGRAGFATARQVIVFQKNE